MINITKAMIVQSHKCTIIKNYFKNAPVSYTFPQVGKIDEKALSLYNKSTRLVVTKSRRFYLLNNR